jgi:hypothetical protein
VHARQAHGSVIVLVMCCVLHAVLHGALCRYLLPEHAAAAAISNRTLAYCQLRYMR